MSRVLAKRWNVLRSAAAVTTLSLALSQASLAEVRSCTLGIDINCPSGLSE